VRGKLMSNGASGYHPFPGSTIPSRAYFAQAAFYDYMGTSTAYSHETAYDNQGCDMLPLAVSCSTNNGSCCDTHDACYAKNQCSASSWLYTGLLTALISKCAACNTAAVGCFAGGGTGPSACCSGGTCGQPWGKPGQGGQCLCQDKPNDCNSSACTGNDGGAGSDAAQGNEDGGGNGNDGGTGDDGGAGADGGTGDDGGGAGEAGGGTDGGYATSAPSTPDRHHPITVATGSSTSIALTWTDAAGVAPAADLWVESDGRTVLQISSLGSHPFVRAGLDVAALEADTPYRLVLERDDDTVKITFARVTGDRVLHAEVRIGGHVPGGPIADVVLPGAFWRSSIVSELP
jgi:hypothetical protein